MSIFDDEEKQSDDIDRNTFRMRYDFMNKNKSNLSDNDYEEYCMHLSKVDVFYRHSVPGLPNFSEIRKNIKVIFSAAKPMYSKRYDKKWFKKDCVILGEYFHKDKCIHLYIENIKGCCKSKIEIKRLLLSTYIHELYHAYFESGNRYIPEIEEPLAEFGTLFCMDAMAYMGVIVQKEVSIYHSRVNKKKKALPIYAFGGYIFEKHQPDLRGWKMGLLLKNYKLCVKKDRLNLPQQGLSSYDPNLWETAYNDLKKALRYVD